MNYLGDFTEDATIQVYFPTSDGSGGKVAASAPFGTGDFFIYKNGSATQKATVNGITVTSPFDSRTGLHLVTIDTSNDTGDAGFWEAGNNYAVIAEPTPTVDSQSLIAVLATFSIQN